MSEPEATAEGAVCPSCEQVIPVERFQLHLDGLDGARAECPRQDLEAIVQRSRTGGYGSWEFFAREAMPTERRGWPRVGGV